VRYHGAPAGFVHQGNVLAITLPTPLSLGAVDSVTVYYGGPPAETGFGSFVQTTHDGTPIVWTLSEPYGARDWWPCKQDLTDKIDSIDVLVTCPAAYRAAGNGLLVSEADAGSGQKTYHWKHRYPIAAYLVAIAVTNYAQYTDYADIQTGSLPILNYVFPENLAASQNQTPQVVPIMEFYDSLFISYPFHKEKYGHAQFGWGGGMEHQTMSFMVNFGYELMAHELAHQWFGDHVTCGSWEDIWLNEGFATYLSGLCYERFSPTQYWPSFKSSRLGNVVSQPGGSVWVNDTTSVGRIFSGRLSYSKGAMVLHQLRWTIGDSAFFAGIRSYLNAPGISGEFARTADLQSYLETASGQDLDWYFDDWFYGQGFPSYHIEWSQAGNTVWLTVNQTQSHPSVDFFQVPLPLRFRAGSQSFDARIEPTVSGQSFQLTVPFAATELQIDPDIWLISANNTATKVAVGTDDLRAAGYACRIEPNPVQDAEIRALLSSPATATARISLETSDGRTLLAREESINAGENRLNIQHGDLPAGMYLMRVRVQGGELVEKVLIQR
jgi:aminopeptidase N